MNAVKASRVITPAPPNRKYSVPIASDNITRGILTYEADHQPNGCAGAERRRAQGPSARNVAQVVDAQVNTRQPDQDRERKSGHEQRGAPHHPGAQADRDG